MDLLQAASIIRREANKRDALVAAADALDRIGSLEQAEREAQGRLEAKKKELDAAEQAVEAARRREIDLVEHADSEVVKATHEANLERAQGKASAEQIVAEAQATARLVEQSAEDHAERVRAESAQIKQMAQDASDTAKAALESAQSVLSERRAELADLDIRIAKARAEAAKILGS